MTLESQLLAYVLLALLVALVVSFLMTPVVKTFAYKVGAIDVPKDNRRMHKTPIPRLGGLAIFIGFMVSILLFTNITREMQSILLGAVIIVVLGVVVSELSALRQPVITLTVRTRTRARMVIFFILKPPVISDFKASISKYPAFKLGTFAELTGFCHIFIEKLFLALLFCALSCIIL